MDRPPKDAASFRQPSTPGSAMDKTTRHAWEILDADAQERDARTARLRKTRLEREAATPPPPAKPAGKSSGKPAVTPRRR